MRRDGRRLQVLPECGHYLGRYRTCPSDTQETILVLARSISELRVTKANLGSSTRLILRQGVNLKCCRRRGRHEAAPGPRFERPKCTSSVRMLTSARCAHMPTFRHPSDVRALPRPVVAYVAATNAFDLDRLLATFADDALVNDQLRDYWGKAA